MGLPSLGSSVPKPTVPQRALLSLHSRGDRAQEEARSLTEDILSNTQNQLSNSKVMLSIFNQDLWSILSSN